MDNKATTKRMIGAVVLVLVAALLLAWLLKGKNRDLQNANLNQPAETKTILGFPEVSTDANGKPILVPQDNTAANAGAGLGANPQVIPVEPAPAANTPTTAPAAGFAVRPTAPAPTESRQVVDTDGQVKNGLGNIGSNDTKAPTTTTTDLTGAETQPLSLPSSESKATGHHATEAASTKDRPAASKTSVSAPEEKRSPRPVLVGEKAVAKDAELASGKSMSAIEKAAAEKSLALAKEEKGEKAEKASIASAKDSETSAGGDYSIQLMASSDKAKAEEVRKAMTAEGYKVALVEAKVDGKAIYRVRVGDYPKKEDAAAAQAKMKERYTKNTYVQNSFVTR
jgi:cell division septation protein DedD